MSTDNQNTHTADRALGLKRPFMLAYTVKPVGDGGRNSIWSKIGAAWAHKDGQGFEVRMDAVPVDGRIVLRTVKDSESVQSGDVVEHTSE